MDINENSFRFQTSLIVIHRIDPFLPKNSTLTDLYCKAIGPETRRPTLHSESMTMLNPPISPAESQPESQPDGRSLLIQNAQILQPNGEFLRGEVWVKAGIIH